MMTRQHFLRLLLTACQGACLLALSVCHVTFAAPLKVTDRTISQDSERVTAEYFGLHIHHLDVPYRDGTSSWPFVAFGSWRLWGAYVRWADLEPKKGQWSFGRLDRYVAQGRAHGTDLLLTLGGTPKWASARPDERCDGCAAEPVAIDDWRIYVRTVVRRYKGQISAYEVWNEPRFHELEGVNRSGEVGYYSGSVAKLVELAQVAKEVIAQDDPNAKLVSPSFVSGDLGIRRLEFFLKAGGGNYFDILGFHFYADVPEKIPDMNRKLVNLKTRYHLDSVPIWSTEMGFTYERPDLSVFPTVRKGSFEDVLPARLGAAFLSRSLILAAASGIKRFYWLNWDGEPPHPTMGIAAVRGTKATPMTNAYTRTRAWLVGTIVGPCESRPEAVWLCKFQSKDGRNAWAVWTEGKDIVADFSDVIRGGQLEHLLRDDIEKIADPKRISVGPEPVLLRP